MEKGYYLRWRTLSVDGDGEGLDLGQCLLDVGGILLVGAVLLPVECVGQFSVHFERLRGVLHLLVETHFFFFFLTKNTVFAIARYKNQPAEYLLMILTGGTAPVVHTTQTPLLDDNVIIMVEKSGQQLLDNKCDD